MIFFSDHVDHAAHNARCDLELEDLTFKITSLSDILKNQEKNTLSVAMSSFLEDLLNSVPEFG